MHIFEKYPQGYWTTNGKKFINKYEAMCEATHSRQDLSWVYFDNIWQNFDRSLLGKYSLDELYLENARRIRDKYDYLILYFSGGADSYNILKTFLDNSIQLDEICVKWTGPAIKSNVKVYTPNTINKEPTNYISEWDYAIKPVLDEISQTHPQIKIEIVDWINDLNIDLESAFNIVNHWHDIEVPSLAIWSPNEIKMLDKGKTVGSMYGIDKPIVYFKDSAAYLVFSDAPLAVATPNPFNINGTEMFYWTPEFPLLAFEMANIISRWIIKDQKRYESLAYTSEKFSNRFFNPMSDIYQLQQKMFRNILYTNWTNSFQALKPKIVDRTDKHKEILKLPEFSKYKDQYYSLLRSKAALLSDNLVYKAEKSDPSSYVTKYSKRHHLFDIKV